jgi:hypothetical protein
LRLETRELEIRFGDPDGHVKVLPIYKAVRISRGNLFPKRVTIQTTDKWMFVFDTEEASSAFESKRFSIKNDRPLHDTYGMLIDYASED